MWIRKLNATSRKYGYNLLKGGDGGDTFSIRSKSSQNITRSKLSKASSNISEITKQKHRENTKKLWANSNYRNKVIEKIKAIKRTPESKEKFSKIMKAALADPNIRKKEVKIH